MIGHWRPSVVVLLVGLLGPHGALRDRGQRGARHAGRLHDLDVAARQTRQQLVARGAAREEELVRHSGQHGAEHRADPVNLRETGRQRSDCRRGSDTRFDEYLLGLIVDRADEQ